MALRPKSGGLSGDSGPKSKITPGGTPGVVSLVMCLNPLSNSTTTGVKLVLALGVVDNRSGSDT